MDKWEEMKSNLRRLENDPAVDQDLLRTMDTLSLADYWKRRWEEERELSHMLRQHLGELEDKLKEERQKKENLEQSLDDKRRLWDQTREALEEKFKVKDMENKLLQERGHWENRFQEALGKAGKAASPSQGHIPLDEDEYVRHELRRLTQEFLALRDSTEQYQNQKVSLEREKENLVEMLKSKTDKETESIVDLIKMKESLGKVGQQINEFQQSFFQRLEAGLVMIQRNTQPPPVESAPPREDWQSENTGESVGKFSKTPVHSIHLMYESFAQGFCDVARKLLGTFREIIQKSMANNSLDSESKTQIHDMDNIVTFLMESIEDYLQLIHHPELNKEDVNLNQLIQPLLTHPQIQYSLEPKIPTLKLDKELILETVKQVINNAQEASENNSLLSIQTEYNARSKQVILSVKDKGKGIKEAHFKRVLHPYFSTKGKKKGMGLALAQKSMVLHGGKIQIKSAPGSGTTVSLEFSTP
ncbi:hypothetical protein BVX98_01665 [bacterium F11]|nr:hypothetical protein BVX98_01665 [bacterium F11]